MYHYVQICIHFELMCSFVILCLFRCKCVLFERIPLPQWQKATYFYHLFWQCSIRKSRAPVVVFQICNMCTWVFVFAFWPILVVSYLLPPGSKKGQSSVMFQPSTAQMLLHTRQSDATQPKQQLLHTVDPQRNFNIY